MMKIRRSRTPSEGDLVALADGSLRASRRIPVERAVSESPQLRSVVDAQRRVLSAIDQVGDVPAPSGLRARLALAQPPPRVRARMWPAGLAVASAAAVLAAVLVIVIAPGGGSGHLTVLEASLVAAAPPQATVAAPSGHDQTLPGVTEAGLTYPYLEDAFGYRTVGVRHDQVGGRHATTVFYSRGASRVAYEIVSGRPLSLGHSSRAVVRGGVVFRTLHSSHGSIVTWVRNGHTCVLLGSGTAVPVMLSLASWHDGGRVPY